METKLAYNTNKARFKMAPIITLKGPKKADNNVSVYSTKVLDQKNTQQNMNVKIRLSPTTLRNLTEEPEPEYDDDSELSALDHELNKALFEDSDKENQQKEPNYNVTLKYSLSPERSFKLSPNSPTTSPAASSNTYIKQEPEPTKTNNTKVRQPTYRTIPPNLIMILKREFGLLNETVEEMNMIEKIIFTLRDPLTTTKIRLPVKSIICQHFECFDFDNFCLFNHLPMGIKNVLRKDLIRRSNDLKKRDKMLATQSQEFNKMDIYSLTKRFIYQPNFNTLSNLSQNYPMYKCPICNKSFELNQLFISDIFNYFIKTTPMNIDRIELRDMIKYRIVEEEYTKETDEEEVIVLSEEENDTNTTDPAPQNSKEHHRDHNSDHSDHNSIGEPLGGRSKLNSSRSNSDDFSSDDSFEQAYKRYASQHDYTGSGSWEDPVTLD